MCVNNLGLDFSSTRILSVTLNILLYLSLMLSRVSAGLASINFNYFISIMRSHPELFDQKPQYFALVPSINRTKQVVTLSPAALLPSCARIWMFPPKIPLLCSSSAGQKQLIVVVFLSSSFPLLRKSRAGEFLVGTFKRALMAVIKRQDLKWPPDYRRWSTCFAFLINTFLME